MSSGTEIVEEGISEIELAASQTWNRSFKPENGKVKWFRDELGQLWVKFRDDKVSGLERVWPASRVVQVVYKKDSCE